MVTDRAGVCFSTSCLFVLGAGEWDDDEEWPEWETLDYIAARAYRLVTGTGDECGEDFYDAVRSQLGGTAFRRHPDGERWDAADEPAAAMKIPALAASFPLNNPI